ncbi:hypothetical protein [Acinetobacter silvestris]|uniref:Uncharacterized protein n=1 Tax=Acinetobacter silvestris TaxID=1977882 RepID=A0A1Y3CFR1_9GAMM|nr:hypothetical protein [Acinetobacter silvestris]OTG65460.1 hypothetical protein B9T28_08325 [Acinetobacter silvestris]
MKNELADYKKISAKIENDALLLQTHIKELENLLARAYFLNELFKETLQEHKVEFHHPLIDDETTEKYKF